MEVIRTSDKLKYTPNKADDDFKKLETLFSNTTIVIIDLAKLQNFEVAEITEIEK